MKLRLKSNRDEPGMKVERRSWDLFREGIFLTWLFRWHNMANLIRAVMDGKITTSFQAQKFYHDCDER